MADDTTPGHTEPRRARTERAATGVTPWLRRTVPFALVATGLVGVAVWGHRSDWTFTQTRRPAEPAADGLARVRVGGPMPVWPDIPSALRREVVIEFESADAVDAAGIGIVGVWPGPFAEVVEAGGEVGFDPALVARVGPRAAGTVWRVTKKPGDSVAAGDVLALVDAAEVGKAKADFQQALAQVRFREQTLAGHRAAAKVVSAQSVREAEADLAESQTRLLAATQALANFDLPVNPADYRSLPLDAVIKQMRLLGVPPGTSDLDPKIATANLIPVRAPLAGVVLSADAVAGEVVEPGRPLFVVADPRRVWVTLHVRAADAGRVAVGLAVRFRPDGADEFGGRVEWVGRTADEATRTVPVRAVLPNEAGRLRAGTLGQGRVIVRQEARAVLVPHDAVQAFRGTPVVFVRDPDYLKPGGPKAFRARVVRVGARDAEHTEILTGLVADEVVATKGSGLLLNELTRAIDGADAGR